MWTYHHRCSVAEDNFTWYALWRSSELRNCVIPQAWMLPWWQMFTIKFGCCSVPAFFIAMVLYIAVSYNMMLHRTHQLHRYRVDHTTHSPKITISFPDRQAMGIPVYMMTSSNGNIFHVTGHLCGEFTGLRWIPCTKASDTELWCFLWSAPE